MKHGFLYGAHPLSKMVFLVFLMMLSVFIISIVGILIAVPFFQLNAGDLLNMGNLMQNPSNTNFLKYIQFLQSLSLFVVPPFLLALTIERPVLPYLQFNKNGDYKTILLITILAVVMIPAINFFSGLNAAMKLPPFLRPIEEWMQQSERNAGELTKRFLQANSFTVYLFNLFLIAVLPAIGEELTFRGMFQRFLGDWVKNAHWGIIISAFLFSAIHLQFYGFLPRFVLGLIFGYLLYWSGNIWLPILAHFLNNGLATTAYYLFGDEVSTSKIEDMGSGFDLFNTSLALVSITFSVLILISLYKRLKVESVKD
jgi:uncharacterized protein